MGDGGVVDAVRGRGAGVGLVDWERAGHAPLSGDGNGFATRYAEDFALLAELGLTHHRLSIEWARIEPERRRARRRRRSSTTATCSTAARDAGVAPWVCLHHFTLPRWFADDGGFLVEANRTDAWARHVDFVAETFGDLVAGWQPVNETNYYAVLAYGGRGWPPGHNDPRRTGRSPTRRSSSPTPRPRCGCAQTGAPVASIFGLSPAVALDDDPASLAAVERIPRHVLGRRASACSATACCACPAATPSSAPTSPARST